MYLKKEKSQKTKLEKEQIKLLESMSGTVKHFFGGWEKIFGEVSDPRIENLLIYPLSSLLFTGMLMYLLRLGSRRQINFDFRKNENVAEKFHSLWGVDEVSVPGTLKKRIGCFSDFVGLRPDLSLIFSQHRIFNIEMFHIWNCWYFNSNSQYE